MTLTTWALLIGLALIAFGVIPLFLGAVIHRGHGRPDFDPQGRDRL